MLELVSALANSQRALQREYQKALEPMVVHIESMVPIQKRMTGILPPQSVCDELVDFYFNVLETMYPIIHKASFIREYKEYWDGKSENDSLLPRLLCILCFGTRFGPSSSGYRSSIHIPTACVLVRDWLDGVRNKDKVDAYTLQTELLLRLAQWTIGVQKQAAWAHFGYVVRMAMEMGLHQDPSDLAGISEFNKEYRRKLWFAIMEMDFHLSLARNRIPLLGQKDYSCQPPRNRSDSELPVDARVLPESKPIEQVTDSHVQAFVARTLPMRMEAVELLARLDATEDQRRILEVGSRLEKILDVINDRFPRHILGKGDKHKTWRVRVLLDFHLRRPLMALYRPVVVGRANCSAHILWGFLRSCMAVLRYLDDEPVDDRSIGSELSVLSLFVLQQALIEAAIDVCWFIKQAREVNFANGLMWVPPPNSAHGGVPEPGAGNYIWYVKPVLLVTGVLRF
ncbi:fungal-specific transcription factor domain-containing protein [Corynascus novoguineensis]|uniref:Fungal-specific transcription factor domain-containing protein n=1 Tax=Corynascus novoguineensis TaxID=1126955 RepID=A0AAN7CP26_9PEZI|nr:fungal-specific transcription factor domain-containing protein [Corynascus novoguineensis]